MRRDAEGVELLVGQLGSKQFLNGVEIGGDLRSEVELGDAHAVGDAPAHSIPVGVFAQGEAYHKVGLPDTLDAGALDGAAEVARKAAQEHGAVLALKRGFVELDNYKAFGFHRRHFNAQAQTPLRNVLPALACGRWTDCSAFQRRLSQRKSPLHVEREWSGDLFPVVGAIGTSAA